MRKSPYRYRVIRAFLVLTLTLLLPLFLLTPATASEFKSEINESQTGENPYIVNLSAETPQIAILLPLSGPFAILGQSLRKGFELGFAQPPLNSNQTIHQYKIQFLDSKGEPDTARTLIALLNSEGETVIAAGTPLNTTAWNASKACEEIGLPYLIVGADQDNLIGNQSVFSFRLTQTHSAYIKLLSTFIDSQTPEIQSMGIIYGESYCATRQARRLRKFCADKNIDLAIWKTYRSNERNFYDLLNLIKERKPQLLFLATSPAASNKLCQQGQRLEFLPSLTIATPVNCLPVKSEIEPIKHASKPVLYATLWLKPANRKNLPQIKDYLQAQGFAAAELIRKTLEQSSNLTSGEIVKTLENTSMNTVYGPVNFSGPGPGHQNPLSWHLCSYNEDGSNQLVFPLLPSSETGDKIEKRGK
ncbi:MAG: ABC transporter substrate-binding protein [Deltaproteobacteria bacterium]|nr:ABC transporter substrate-binding protein [Candidatus Tharpella sp.]